MKRPATVGRAVQRRWRRVRTDPFAGEARPLLVHVCYHKAGTVWFDNVLGSVARDFGLRLEIGRGKHQIAPTRRADIFLQQQGRLDLASLRAFRGTHIVRDPRDTVVSAYAYHLWTEEPWANKPKPEYGGATYREHLQLLDREEGMATEIERSSRLFRTMAEWDYDDERFLELRFEDLRAHGAEGFRPIFRHYGFSEAAIEQAMHWVDHHSWERVKEREAAAGKDGPSHLRSARTGEWREELSPAHLERIEELAGPLMRRLGYD